MWQHWSQVAEAEFSRWTRSLLDQHRGYKEASGGQSQCLERPSPKPDLQMLAQLPLLLKMSQDRQFEGAATKDP